MEEVWLGAEGANSRRGIWGMWGGYSRYRVGVRDNSGRISLGFGVGSGGEWWDRSGAGDSGWFGFGDTRDRTWEGFYRL